MAKTEAQIYLDYAKATRQASQLEQIASNLDRLKNNDLESCLSQISSHWESDNSGAYISKGRTLQGKIGTTAGEIRNAARVIRQMAKNTYDAEMRALQIARMRTY